MEDFPYIQLIIYILISMLMSAFFSGMEIAFVSSNRLLAEVDRNKHRFSDKFLGIFYENPNGFVSTMLVGNNIVNVVYGILIARLFDNTIFQGLAPGLRITADTIISTIIMLFVGEFVPKSLFKKNANTLLSFLSPIAYFFYIILWPVSRFSTSLSSILLRFAGIRLPKETASNGFSKVDLDYLLQKSIDNSDDETIESDVRIFQNALDFSDIKVRDCMIPRTEINAIDMNDSTVGELKQKFIESGNTKIIVYNDDIDHIVGYIHSAEMFRNRENWREHLQTLPFVPETMAAEKLMKTLIKQKKSLAVVVDEFGGTSGLVSLEDVVEEIFGDIEDEHDSINYIAKQINKDRYLLSGRLEVSKANELFDLHLPVSDDYMTIGGMILFHYQSFPKLHDVIDIGNFEFKIMKKTMTKIELVQLQILHV